MIRQIVESSGYYHFAEVGLVLFAAVFVMVLFNAFRRSKSEISELSQMALEQDEIENNPQITQITQIKEKSAMF